MITRFSNFIARLGRPTALIGLALATPACTGSGGPDSVLSGPSATSAPGPLSSPFNLAPSRVVATFPLLNGSFTVTLPDANGTVSTIKGSYAGQAVAAIPGNTTATLDLQVAESAALGSGVTGHQAEGSGSFIDEGNFTLTLSLTLPTSKSPDGSATKFTVRGASRVSCSVAHRILVTQHGTGSLPRLGDIAVDLQHEVGNTGCS